MSHLNEDDVELEMDSKLDLGEELEERYSNDEDDEEESVNIDAF